MAILVKNGGAWAFSDDIFVKSGGVWQQAKEIWVKNGGGWSRALLRILDLYITTNVYNYNIRNATVAAGWNQTDRIRVNVIVNSGVVVSASNTADFGLYSGDPWPAGSEIVLYNYGTIAAHGGDGGIGGNASQNSGFEGSGSPGTAGGTAMLLSAPTTIHNYGTIAGGGGGGGGGGGNANQNPPRASGGGGGGGGRTGLNNSAGGAGGIGSTSGSNQPGTPGGAGTLSAAGGGGLGGQSSVDGGPGGNGGNWGAGGVPGTALGGGGGAGGAAGNWVSGAAFVTFAVTGTVLGGST